VTRLTACLPAGWMMTKVKAKGQTVGETLGKFASRFEKISEMPCLDAQVLLAYFLDRPRSWVLAHPEVQLTENQQTALESLVVRFEQGEPLPYILGNWEFFDLQFDITPDVLIPRPETELLVERGIDWLKQQGRNGQELLILDIGTGSGCIAISLAVNVPGLSITATDLSPDALRVANANAKKMNVSDRITFLESDLFLNPLIPGSFSLVVANPPYIPTKTLCKTNVYDHEPTLALDGGIDGMALIRRILQELPNRLIPSGLLLMEIEASEGSSVLSLARSVFPEARINLHKDLAGHDRLLEVQV
jgi:release factor glutamine methyltransferase